METRPTAAMLCHSTSNYRTLVDTNAILHPEEWGQGETFFGGVLLDFSLRDIIIGGAENIKIDFGQSVAVVFYDFY